MNWMFNTGLRHILVLRLLAIVLCAYAVTGCGIPSPDPGSAQGKAQILDDVDYYLSIGDCGDALIEITPLYNSSNTDNTVRMAMASVYACSSGFNFFNFVNTATSANVSSTSFLFEFMAQEFPSTGIADKVVESGGYAIDALQAAITPGTVLITNDLINTSTYNEGSLLYTDRTTDSNEYLFFVSMAAIGGEENRLGATASGAPSAGAGELPWTYPAQAAMSTTGCAYASALVNFADSIASIPGSAASDSKPASTDALAYVAWFLNTATNTGYPGKSFSQTIDEACMEGCEGVPPGAGFMNSNGKWNGAANYTGCSVNSAATCGTTCNVLLRNRNNCTDGATFGPISCAAAGVVNFVNASAIGWQ